VNFNLEHEDRKVSECFNNINYENRQTLTVCLVSESVLLHFVFNSNYKVDTLFSNICTWNSETRSLSSYPPRKYLHAQY
jgi:hypothetical protein